MLSREIDLQKAPYAQFEDFECNVLSRSEACYNEIKSSVDSSSAQKFKFIPEINVIDLQIAEISKDKCYTEKFELASSDKSNEYYKIENGVLFHRFNTCKNPSANEWKICIPLEDRGKIISEQHDTVPASHPGFFKTLNRLQQTYYWPKMFKQVYAYDICH